MKSKKENYIRKNVPKIEKITEVKKNRKKSKKPHKTVNKAYENMIDRLEQTVRYNSVVNRRKCQKTAVGEDNIFTDIV